MLRTMNFESTLMTEFVGGRYTVKEPPERFRKRSHSASTSDSPFTQQNEIVDRTRGPRALHFSGISLATMQSEALWEAAKALNPDRRSKRPIRTSSPSESAIRRREKFAILSRENPVALEEARLKERERARLRRIRRKEKIDLNAVSSSLSSSPLPDASSSLSALPDSSITGGMEGNVSAPQELGNGLAELPIQLYPARQDLERPTCFFDAQCQSSRSLVEDNVLEESVDDWEAGGSVGNSQSDVDITASDVPYKPPPLDHGVVVDCGEGINASEMEASDRALHEVNIFLAQLLPKICKS